MSEEAYAWIDIAGKISLIVVALIGLLVLLKWIHDVRKEKKAKNDILVDPESIDTLEPAALIQAECGSQQAAARKKAWEKINAIIRQSVANGTRAEITSDIYKVIPYKMLADTLASYGYVATCVTGSPFDESDYRSSYHMYLAVKEEAK